MVSEREFQKYEGEKINARERQGVKSNTFWSGGFPRPMGQRESYHYSADRWIRRRRRRQLMLQEEKPLVVVSPNWIRFTGRAYADQDL